jgi:hypothetical protein
MNHIGYVRVSRVGGREGESFISPDVQANQASDRTQKEKSPLPAVFPGNKAFSGYGQGAKGVRKGTEGANVHPRLPATRGKATRTPVVAVLPPVLRNGPKGVQPQPPPDNPVAKGGGPRWGSTCLAEGSFEGTSESKTVQLRAGLIKVCLPRDDCVLTGGGHGDLFPRATSSSYTNGLASLDLSALLFGSIELRRAPRPQHRLG